MVNDSNAQEVLERDPQTQIMTTETSKRVQNQSSRHSLMAPLVQGDPLSKVLI